MIKAPLSQLSISKNEVTLYFWVLKGRFQDVEMMGTNILYVKVNVARKIVESVAWIWSVEQNFSEREDLKPLMYRWHLKAWK